MRKRNRRVSLRTIQTQPQQQDTPSALAEIASVLVIVAIAILFWFAALGTP